MEQVKLTAGQVKLLGMLKLIIAQVEAGTYSYDKFVACTRLGFNALDKEKRECSGCVSMSEHRRRVMEERPSIDPRYQVVKEKIVPVKDIDSTMLGMHAVIMNADGSMTDSWSERYRQDVELYGNYIEVDGVRVDPLKVKHITIKEKDVHAN